MFDGLPREAHLCGRDRTGVFLQRPPTGQPIKVAQLQKQCPIPEIWASVSKEPSFGLDLSGAFT